MSCKTIKKTVSVIICASLLVCGFAFTAFARNEQMVNAIDSNFKNITFSSSTLGATSRGEVISGYGSTVAESVKAAFRFEVDSPFVVASNAASGVPGTGEKLSDLEFSADTVFAFTCDALDIGGKKYYVVLHTSKGAAEYTDASYIKQYIDKWYDDVKADPTAAGIQRATDTWLTRLVISQAKASEVFNNTIASGAAPMKGRSSKMVSVKKRSNGSYRFNESGKYYNAVTGEFGNDLRDLAFNNEGATNYCAFKCNLTDFDENGRPYWVVCRYLEKASQASSAQNVEAAWKNAVSGYLQSQGMTEDDAEAQADEECTGMGDTSVRSGTEIVADGDVRVMTTDEFIASLGNISNMQQLNIEPLSLLNAEPFHQSGNPAEKIVLETFQSFYGLIMVIAITGMVVSLLVSFSLLAIYGPQARHMVLQKILSKVGIFMVIVCFGTILGYFAQIIKALNL